MFKPKKVKVILFKEGCLPRIYTNPTKEHLRVLNTEGVVLINPNERKTKGFPLHHCYPDKENNELRLIKEENRLDSDLLESVKENKNKMEEEGYFREFCEDYIERELYDLLEVSIKEERKSIDKKLSDFHKLALLYALNSGILGMVFADSLYEGRIWKSLKLMSTHLMMYLGI